LHAHQNIVKKVSCADSTGYASRDPQLKGKGVSVARTPTAQKTTLQLALLQQAFVRTLTKRFATQGMDLCADYYAHSDL